MTANNNLQKSESQNKNKRDKKQEAYTSISFWRSLGVPVPEGDTVEEVVDSMKKLGAEPWTPNKTKKLQSLRDFLAKLASRFTNNK